MYSSFTYLVKEAAAEKWSGRNFFPAMIWVVPNFSNFEMHMNLAFKVAVAA